MADIVDQLLERPGTYVGKQGMPHGDESSDAAPSVARIDVTPLPGKSGVMMTYEVISPTDGVVHHEHAVLARTKGGVTLVTSHTHDEVTVVLAETEPGYFPADEGATSFPMAIRLEVPDEELARRRAQWKAPPPRFERGYGVMFSRHILQADQGCDFDYLETSYGGPTGEPAIY